MKKILALISMCLGCVFLCCSCESQQEVKKRVAILTPATHPSLIRIEEAFIKTMLKGDPDGYSFVTYNAQGNKTLMHSEIEEISQRDYALVLTLGTSTSRMTREVFDKKGVTMPIVFTCVPDPFGVHIAPGASVTGVEELLHLDDELQILLKIKPDMQSVLLVYNPVEAGAEHNKQEIERFLKKNHIQLVAIETFQTNEIQAKVSPFMDKVDAVIVLKDNTVVSGLDVLVKLCNRFHVPLMASDLDSSRRGAALAYGVYEAEFGVEAARKALQILQEGISPSEISVTPISQFTLQVNLEAAKKQGLDMSLIEQLDYEAIK